METVIFFVDGEKNRGVFRGDLGLRRAVSGISGLAHNMYADDAGAMEKCA